jgi:hypothetical protein
MYPVTPEFNVYALLGYATTTLDEEIHAAISQLANLQILTASRGVLVLRTHLAAISQSLPTMLVFMTILLIMILVMLEANSLSILSMWVLLTASKNTKTESSGLGFATTPNLLNTHQNQKYL